MYVPYFVHGSCDCTVFRQTCVHLQSTGSFWDSLHQVQFVDSPHEGLVKLSLTSLLRSFTAANLRLWFMALVFGWESVSQTSYIFSRKVSVFTHLSTSCFPRALTECVDFSVFPRQFTAAHELCCHGCAQLEFSRFHGAPESWQQSWKQAAGFQRMWQAWFEPLAPLQGLWCRLHVHSFQEWIKIAIDIKRSQTIWRRCPSSVASVRTFHSASQRLGFFQEVPRGLANGKSLGMGASECQVGLRVCRFFKRDNLQETVVVDNSLM